MDRVGTRYLLHMAGESTPFETAAAGAGFRQPGDHVHRDARFRTWRGRADSLHRTALAMAFSPSGALAPRTVTTPLIYAKTTLGIDHVRRGCDGRCSFQARECPYRFWLDAAVIAIRVRSPLQRLACRVHSPFATPCIRVPCTRQAVIVRPDAANHRAFARRRP